MCWRASGKIISIGSVIVAAIWSVADAVAHEHTYHAFQRQAAAERAGTLALADEQAAARRQKGTCRLSVQLVDAESARNLPGLVRITDVASQQPLALGDLIERPNDWYATPGPATIEVPSTKVMVEAIHGLQREKASEVLDLTGRPEATVRLPLRAFYRAAARNLRSGNTHLHLARMSRQRADRYLQVVARADELDLVYVSHLRRARDELTYISNSYTADDLRRLSGQGVLLGHGQEHRHNFGAYGEGYGHVMFLDIERLIRPVSIGPGIMDTGTDGIPLRRGIDTARQDGASVIWCHNKFGVEDVPNWVAGVLHAQNIFDGGDHGSYKDSFYRYLNVGLRVPFSTGTDWFVYDFSRVYVPIEGPLSSQAWLGQLAAGRSFITNGPFLELAVGQHRIGDTIRLPKPAALEVRARGVGRNDFRALELIHNGEVVFRVESSRQGMHYQAEMDFSLSIEEPGWVALRIALEADSNEFGEPLFAHTSPIYVELAGKKIFRPRVAQELIAEMERNTSIVKNQAIFANDEEREAVLGVHREGIALLRERLKRGG